MENLRAYLNSLPQVDREAYAVACGTTVNYLRKAISVGSQFDGALARLLDENSGGVCWRREKIDHSYRLKFDQGVEPVFGVTGCG